MTGKIEVICGSMFSGKSDELLRRLERGQYADKKITVYKPNRDTRYSKGVVKSRSGREMECISTSSAMDILHHATANDTEIVGIDEIQFYPQDGIEFVVKELANKGKRVIVSGLDMDYTGKPFEAIGRIMSRAEQVDKLTAICVECGEEATRTQRLVDGQPASKDDDKIVVDKEFSNVKYEARCRACHQVS